MTVYTPTARFDTGRALTEDELRAVAPSVFAVTAHKSRSERFKPIPTIEILHALAKEGFVAVGATQSMSREPGRAPFTKHLIRLRHVDAERSYSVGDTVCEILLKNANDGTSVYDLFAGLFRIRCMNSLVSNIGTVDSIKVRHSGDAIGKVIDGTYRVLKSAKLALAAPADWSNVQLEKPERITFAEAAHAYRFEGMAAAKAIQPESLLTPRRADDTATDLWTTFNVIQENVIRGGLCGHAQSDDGRIRRITSRAVKGIDQDLKLNRALWSLAEKMAEIKGIAKAA